MQSRPPVRSDVSARHVLSELAAILTRVGEALRRYEAAQDSSSQAPEHIRRQDLQELDLALQLLSDTAALIGAMSSALPADLRLARAPMLAAVKLEVCKEMLERSDATDRAVDRSRHSGDRIEIF